MKNYYTNVRPSAITAIKLWYGILVSLVLLNPANGQVKKNLEISDYKLWSKLYMEGISHNGSFISYRLDNTAGDSLFVRTASGKLILAFGPNTQGLFERDSYLSLDNHRTLTVTALKTGNQFTLDGILDCKASSRKILCLSLTQNDTVLNVYSLGGRLLYRRSGVVSIEPAPYGTIVAITTSSPQKGISLMDLKNGRFTEIASMPILPKALYWSEDANAIFWKIEVSQGSEIGYYHLKTSTLSRLQPESRPELDGMDLLPGSRIIASPDGQYLQFKVRSRLISLPPEDLVEVWHTGDKVFYPNKKLINGWKKIPKQVVWKPGNDRCVMITDTLYPHGGTFAGGRFALSFTPYGYFSEVDNVSPRDIYLTDIESGGNKCIIKAHDGNTLGLLPSPKGKYIAYEKEGAWYLYNTENGTHTYFSHTFTDNNTNVITQPSGKFEVAGWDTNDSHILVYDAYDLFKLSPDGRQVTRLTFGREQGITYRLVPQRQSEKLQYENRIAISGMFDLSATLLLRGHSRDNDQTGYFLMSHGGITKLFYGPKKVSNCMGSADGKTFVWTEESYSQPPTLVHAASGKPPKVLYQSNPQQNDFTWGRCEIISYPTTSFGTLKGLLYYPANYKPGTLYPMVTSVYEKQSGGVHDYIAPNLYNNTGLNVTNLVTAGYFVLLPDIQYTTDKAGDSALECVLAALDYVASMRVVDDKMVGLIGHSFGGFETDYIICKTGRFACAVAGAAITDYLSHYLSIAKNQNTPNYGKSERGQARMGGSLYERTHAYLENSPVLLAEGVTTPLLSWTGERDFQVEYTQTIEFFLALRRLGKPNTMLIYPGEEHALMTPEKDADLTLKVTQWLDYYLKGLKQPDWMTKEISGHN